MVSFIPFPVLFTERLILRRLILSDDKELFLIRSSEEVNKYLDRQPAVSIEDAKAFIKKINEGIDKNSWVYWAISLKNDHKLIGTICIWNISAEQNKAEIGYELLPIFHGRGIMNEALTKVINFGFDKMNLHYFEAFTHKNNIPSIKLLEKNNFKRGNNSELKYEKEFNEQNMLIYLLSKDERRT